MKKTIQIIILSIFFILSLCGCARQQGQTVYPVITEKEPVSGTNSLENLHGEEFLLALVNCDDAFISRYFGGQREHKGVDIVAPEGKEIYAAEDGTVSRVAEMNLGYGNHIIIDHNGYRTLYAHCSRLLVTEGQTVKQGDIIALVGNSGNSTGAHLHFEVIDTDSKEKINPLDRF